MITFRIRELLEESKKTGKKVTQTGLAKAAGTSQTTIWKIVEGKTKAPDPQILLAIAGVFTEALDREITIDDLIQKDERQGQESSITPLEPDKPAPDTSSKDDEVLRAIEHLENRMDKGFAEVNRQIADLHKEVGKSN